MSQLKVVYQAAVILLALVAVWLVTLPDEPRVDQANVAIWAIFMVDYVVRLALAPKRRQFAKDNIPDLIAVLPIDLLLAEPSFGIARMLRLARFVRLMRLLRAGVVLWRASRSVRNILRTNGLGYVLLFAAMVIVCGGLAISIVEPEVGTVADGMWWSIVTATTVGYGDISPKTLVGRAIAALLMLVGIGTIGMITGSIATYFLGQRRPANPHVSHVLTQLERWEDLSPEERRQLAEILRTLAQQ